MENNTCDNYCSDNPTKVPGLKQFALLEFKGHRRELFLNYKNAEICKDDYAIVTADVGFDIGKVVCALSSTEEILHRKYGRAVSKTIVRKASEEDLENAYINRAEEDDIVLRTRIIVQSYGLDLKIIDVEWQFDRQKLTVFFTAPQRVDFRELVKDLARQFRTRIELRQINTREEIKRSNDSVGVCGLPVCCKYMMLDNNKVSLEQAKKQQISNSISKLSGNCMRVKCCMAFEHSFYEQELSQYPLVHSTIVTGKSIFKVNKVDAIKQEVLLYDLSEKTLQTLSKEKLKELLKTAKITPPETMELTTQSKVKIEDEDLIIDEEF